MDNLRLKIINQYFERKALHFKGHPELRSLNILSMEIMHLSLGWATTGALVVQGIITE